MPAGKEVQPECISQRASSGRLNCSCSRSRDLTAINPVVPEMMKIAALAVSTAPGGNMSLRFQRVSLLPRQKDAENARQHGQIDGQKPLCHAALQTRKRQRAYCNTKTAENGFLIVHAYQERK